MCYQCAFVSPLLRISWYSNVPSVMLFVISPTTFLSIYHLSAHTHRVHNKCTLIFHYYLSIRGMFCYLFVFFIIIFTSLINGVPMKKRNKLKTEPRCLAVQFQEEIFILRPNRSFALGTSVNFGNQSNMPGLAHGIASAPLINYVIYVIKYIIYNNVCVDLLSALCVEFPAIFFFILSLNAVLSLLLDSFSSLNPFRQAICCYYYDRIYYEKKEIEIQLKIEKEITHPCMEIMNWPFRNNHRYAWDFRITFFFSLRPMKTVTLIKHFPWAIFLLQHIRLDDPRTKQRLVRT